MSLVLLGSTSGSVTLQEPAVAGSTVIDLPATSGTMAVLPTATSVLPEASGGTGTTTGYYGFKNRIINGAMVIDQRNAGASVTPTNTGGGTYVIDRFYARVTQASKLSYQQITVAPKGFVNSLALTSLSAYSVTSSDHFNVIQPIEGLNVSDLGWGTADAQTITVSFWVQSSLTGTFGGNIANNAADRAYVFSYTINSANTWEQKTVTITGDTSGTWLTTNAIGLYLSFSVAAGSSTTKAAGSWGSFARSVTGQTSLVGTSGATFYITGVQLEKGSTATSFDYRPYGTELQLCQRYAIVYGGTSYGTIGVGQASSTTITYITVIPPVNLRSAPSISTSGNFRVTEFVNGYPVTVLLINTANTDSGRVISLGATVASGLTQYRPYTLSSDNDTAARLILSSEL